MGWLSARKAARRRTMRKRIPVYTLHTYCAFWCSGFSLKSSAFRARSLAHLVAENSTRLLVRRQLSHAKTFGTGAASQRANTDRPYSQAFNYCRLSQAQWTIHPDTVECEPCRSGSSFLPQTMSTGARQRDAMRHSGPSASIPLSQPTNTMDFLPQSTSKPVTSMKKR